MDIISSSLALFQQPLMEKSVKKEVWVEFLPIGSISAEDSVIEFNVSGTSMDYIDLSKTRLCIHFKIMGVI